MEPAHRSIRTSPQRSNAEWLDALHLPGPRRYWAIVDLRSHLSRAVLLHMARHRRDLAGINRAKLIALVEECVEEALSIIEQKLSTFRGNSRFVMWANLIAIKVAAEKLECWPASDSRTGGVKHREQRIMRWFHLSWIIPILMAVFIVTTGALILNVQHVFSSTERNEAVVRRVIEEIWNQGNLDLAHEVLAADYVEHYPGEGEILGPEGFKECVVYWRTAFANLEFTIEDLLADGDRVTVRWTARGVHGGDLKGIAPTGTHVTFTGTTTYRLADGKVHETWWHWDDVGLIQQIGAMAPAR